MSEVAEWSITGLHEVLWQRIRERFGVRPQGRMIDMGCGPGEFVSRFTDAGWDTVACDYNGDAFRGKVGRHEVCDLNGDWEPKVSKGGLYDLVVAQEIIEHLESPPAFIRKLANITKPGGVCVVTSPNNQDKASRIDYLFHGELPWFRVDQIHTNGHLVPVTIPLLYLFAAASGFELTAFYGYGSRAPLRLNWKGRLFERYLDRKMTGPCLANVINIWFFTKKNQENAGQAALSPEIVKLALDWYQGFSCVRLDEKKSG